MALDQDLDAAMRTWVDALSPHTRRAYTRGLVCFVEYLEQEGLLELVGAPVMASTKAPMRRNAAALREDVVGAAGRFLFAQDAGDVNALVQAYIQHLSALEHEGVPTYTRSTIKQRVSAIRWAVKEARRRGVVPWSLEVVIPMPSKDPKTGRLVVRPGRDMRGPTPAQLQQMLTLAQKRARGRAGDGARWLAVLSLIAHETLREHEIAALDRDDLHLGNQTLTLVRKKAAEPTVLPLSRRSSAALRRWVKRRGDRPGPLLWGSRLVGGRQAVAPDTRLTVGGVAYIVRTLGRWCGVRTSPHKVRHTAITLGQAARERLQIPLQDAMLRAGHRSAAAHERYLDADLDNVRRLSDAVADALREAAP